MKKLLLLSIFALCSISAFAQPSVTFFKEEALLFSKEPNRVDFFDMGKKEIVTAKLDDPSLMKGLEFIHSKYTEWSNVAKENNVTSLDKDIELPEPITAFLIDGYPADVSVKFGVIRDTYMLTFRLKCISAGKAGFFPFTSETEYMKFMIYMEPSVVYDELNDYKKKLQEAKQKTDNLFK